MSTPITCAAVERLVRRHSPAGLPDRRTRQEAASLHELPEIYSFACGSEFRINTLRSTRFQFRTTHGNPAGFTIGANGSRIGIATDLGCVTALVREHLRGCRMLIVRPTTMWTC